VGNAKRDLAKRKKDLVLNWKRNYVAEKNSFVITSLRSSQCATKSLKKEQFVQKAVHVEVLHHLLVVHLEVHKDLEVHVVDLVALVGLEARVVNLVDLADLVVHVVDLVDMVAHMADLVVQVENADF
jgi:hypothetical protein